jgi:hypothetical protein
VSRISPTVHAAFAVQACGWCGDPIDEGQSIALLDEVVQGKSAVRRLPGGAPLAAETPQWMHAECAKAMWQALS